MAHGPHDHHHHGHHHDHEHEPGPARFTDPAQESLSQALRTGFNILRVLMLVLLVAYALSGVFKVNPGQQGLLVRMGQLRTYSGDDEKHTGTPVFPPGTHLALPDPFDEKILVDGRTFKLEIDTFCYSRKPEERNKALAETLPVREKFTPGGDGTVLTGDRNLSHAVWKVEFRVQDAAKFVRNVCDSPEEFKPLLQRLTEEAVIRTVSSLTVEQVTRRAEAAQPGGDYARDVTRRVSAALDKLDAGVVIDQMLVEAIEPGRVRDMFTAVTRAQNDLQVSVAAARQDADRILQETAGGSYTGLIDEIGRFGAAQSAGESGARLVELQHNVDARLADAGGRVAQRLREAETRANQTLNRARQEYEQFVYLRDAYRRYPELTVTRIWEQMREDILTSVQNEIFYVPSAGDIEIFTNRDPQRLIDAETEAYRKRFENP